MVKLIRKVSATIRTRLFTWSTLNNTIELDHIPKMPGMTLCIVLRNPQGVEIGITTCYQRPYIHMYGLWCYSVGTWKGQFEKVMCSLFHYHFIHSFIHNISPVLSTWEWNTIKELFSIIAIYALMWSAKYQRQYLRTLQLYVLQDKFGTSTP